MEKREHNLDVLQDRMMKLKEYAKLQKTPLQMQVNAVKRNIRINIPAILQINVNFSFAIYMHQMGEAPDHFDHIIVLNVSVRSWNQT